MRKGPLWGIQFMQYIVGIIIVIAIISLLLQILPYILMGIGILIGLYALYYILRNYFKTAITILIVTMPFIFLIITTTMKTENKEQFIISKVKCNMYEYAYEQNRRVTCWQILGNKIKKMPFKYSFNDMKECMSYFEECQDPQK